MTGIIVIRRYVPQDWAQVCHIHDLARAGELAAGQVEPRAFRSMVDAAEADEFFDSQTFVACCDRAVVGFVSWNDAYITWLYVDPAHQRRGIGRQLFQHALNEIGPEAWTNMIAGNEPALALYQAAGMEVVWTRPGNCEGYPCTAMRLSLRTSRMHDPQAQRRRIE